MSEQGQITFSGPAALPQERRITNSHLGPILWAIVDGLMILLLTFLALGSAGQVAAEDPLAAGVVLTPELTGIHGQKWLDFNGDGKHTASEPGIADWQIFLAGNGLKLTARTDISGFYTFDGIPAGAYTITEELPLDWEQYWPPAGNHRINYDPAKLDDLKASIKENGVLQPILVREVSDGYEVIAGERRLKAAQALGLEEGPDFGGEVAGDGNPGASHSASFTNGLAREWRREGEDAEQSDERAVDEHGDWVVVIGC